MNAGYIVLRVAMITLGCLCGVAWVRDFYIAPRDSRAELAGFLFALLFLAIAALGVVGWR